MVGVYAESVIPNCVLAVITSSEIIILRENWSKWVMVEDEGVIEGILEKIEGGSSSEQDLIPVAQR